MPAGDKISSASADHLVVDEVVMKKAEQTGQRIAKKVMREMLMSYDHREDIKQVADRYVTSVTESLYSKKHINIYCRQLAAALRKMR